MAQKVLTIGSGGLLTEITDASVSSVTGTAPVVSSGGSTPVISMAKATASVDGYLASGDFTTFNGKQVALGFTPVNKAGDIGVGAITMGALSATSGIFTGGGIALVVGTAGTGFFGNGSALNAYVGSSQVVAMSSSGSASFQGTVGFNGTAAIAKPTITGSRAGNAALASLLTALASYGLITDSTTA